MRAGFKPCLLIISPCATENTRIKAAYPPERGSNG